jgi:hypothetical protein
MLLYEKSGLLSIMDFDSFLCQLDHKYCHCLCCGGLPVRFGKIVLSNKGLNLCLNLSETILIIDVIRSPEFITSFQFLP